MKVRAHGVSWWGCLVPDLGFPGGSVVKNPSALWETRVQSLGQEDPLEEEMAAQSSILAWEVLWTASCSP